MKNAQNYWQLANALAARTLDTDTGSVQRGLYTQARIGEEPQSHDPSQGREWQTPPQLLKKCLVRRRKKKKLAPWQPHL